MFNRISLTADSRDVVERYQVGTVLEGYLKSDDYTPTRPVPVLYSERDRLCLDQYTWGLFPHWAKSSINAPSETFHEEPAYRRLFGKYRCVIPCDGFFTQTGEGKKRRTFRFGMEDGGVFGLAAVYDVWNQPSGGEYRTFTVLTTRANRLMEPYGERMPAVLDEEAAQAWLNPHVQEKSDLLALLQPCAEDRIAVSAAP